MDVPATPDNQRKPSPAIENAVTKLWTQIRRSGEMIVTLRDDNDRLQQRVQDLESGLSHRESNQQRLDQEQQERSERLHAAEAERDALAKQLSRLTAEHDRLRQQSSSDQQVLTRAAAELEELKSAAHDNEFLRAELVTRNNQMHNSQKEILEYRTKVAELEDQVARLEAGGTAVSESAQADSADSNSASSSGASDVTGESAESVENTSETDSILTDAPQEGGSGAEQAADHKTETAEIASADVASAADADGGDTGAAASAEQEDQAESSGSDGRGEIEALRAELARMRRLYDEVSIERERLRQSSAPFQDNLFSTGAVDAGKVEKEWREKNSELYAEIERLAEAKNKAEDELLEALTEIDDLRAKCEGLQTEIKELAEADSRPDSELRAREAQALQLRRQVDQLKTQLKALEAERAAADNSDSGPDAEADTQAMEAANAQLTEYSTRIQELEAELREAREQAGEEDGLSADKRAAIENKVREALARVDSLLEKA